jgi:peptidoglycan/xylan/chitin deacetylase (PgdA/CDA1 family)
MRPGDASFTFGPRPLYPLKAAATRARSLAWRLRPGAAHDRGLRILLYHRVSDDRDPLSVSPRRFREQMELLAASGLVATDVAAATRRLAGDPEAQLIALSFDDGYSDVAEHALPVLETLGFGATVFVATGLVDGTCLPTWYECPPPLLRWPEISELDHRGTLRFEAHSLSHRNLTLLDDGEAQLEIVQSKRVLERELGREVEAFSYPGGVSGEREETLVEDAGYQLAVTCEPGLNPPGGNPFALRRTQIDARDTLLDFRAKLGGGHDTALPGRSLYRRSRYGGSMPARTSSFAYRSR